MDSSWLSWIIQSVTMLGVGAIGFFLKGTLKRIDKLEEEVKDMPLKYALRDDFLRSVANQDKKLDKVLDQISALTSEVSALREAIK